MNNTLQLTTREKTSLLYAMKNKAESDLVLYWHLNTIWEENLNEIKKEIEEKREA